ncbi:MAG: SirA family protein [Candidatus Muproteobacteria bacterium RBG_19FT_COMBO_61_10]|jgi:tRNA 2-thiouridine synthesizing protein A|uniref:SirA family protein n=1 Tax=Candidatus Muproteobacteria bacterium RBG_19FT_COMBO_61_10 TaxID=1817761 RepID=A0A1F6UN97_9PROT|nr:MAG: SirA family protein [Candidatus Muproteobacteria bacterium RBG_19FT_COMBO_61_10]
MSHHRLDARRLLCPMPVIRTQNKLEELQAGDTLEVTCSDPGALHDIPAWCRVHGHEILSTSNHAGEITITLRVKR